MERNNDLKKLMKDNNVKQWEVAEEIGICADWLSKRLRYNLEDSFRDKILNAIHLISRRKNGKETGNLNVIR